MKLKRTLAFVAVVVAAIVLGALLARACAYTPGLSWLAYSRTLGISPQQPLLLDLSVAQLSFGFAIQVSVAQVILIALGLVAYSLGRRYLQRKEDAKNETE